ncbi:hypothetical protein TNCV_3645731 [Trichonephila clavipes]|nr:hypothetical protein TNCV_3645731 [Trichonephila clavipes]
MAAKDILDFVQSPKNIIDADTDDENEMNYAAPVSALSETKNMKSMHRYLDVHSKGEMYIKMDGMEQFDAKKTVQRKIGDNFPKTQYMFRISKNF